MSELEELLIKYFEKNKGKATKDELRKKMNIKGEKQTAIFSCALSKLVEDGCLFFDEKGYYRLFTNEIGLAYGEIEINKNGCGFVHTKDGYTILIENSDLNGALDGDKVIVNGITNKRKDYYSGEIYKVLKRKNGFVTFEVIGNGKNASLVPYYNYQNVNISLNKNELKNLIDGELVKIKVDSECNHGEYKATIVNIIGHKDYPNIDIKLLADKYDVPIDFSKEALNEADNLPKEVREIDLVGRTDLRDKNIVTIDCDNTKDRDDAVYVEKLPNGNYRLIVSISSVNYYIKEGMHLFEEAKERCTSHYPNNTCIPMFPHVISNGICSLNPNVDRLTKTCDMEIDNEGNVIDIKVYNSVINSKMAMKYSDVNKVLDGEVIDKYKPFIEQLNLMKELNDILERAKRSRNSLDFNIPDVEVIQDKKNKPIDFKKTGTGIAENIIENFMLMTNTCIVEQFDWLPIIYRVHENPDPKNVKKAIELLKSSGIDIPKVNNINEHTLKTILDNISNSEEGQIIKSILLRSMKKARYNSINFGHFALQLEKYCHFTSPIRRISDFMTHTIIDEAFCENFDCHKFETAEKDAADVSLKASYAEKIDKLMENEAKLMAMADFMKEHIGEEFEAYVSEINRSGMFVITKNFIQGKVKIADILDDNYYFDEDKNVLIGRNTKNKYRIGNKVFVIAKDASKENRTINFEIPKQKNKKI